MASTKNTMSARASEIRRLAQRVDEAHVAWLDAEADVHAPEGKADQLEREYFTLDAELEKLAREVWCEPVRDLSNIIERAELAYALADDNPKIDIDLRLRGFLGPKSVAEVIMAVLTLTGGPGWERSDQDTDGSRAEAEELACG